MRKNKIIFWMATISIVVLEIILPFIAAGSTEIIRKVEHLGYPAAFGFILMSFKIIGGFVLLYPRVPNIIKEFVYAGFAIDFIAAFVSVWAVDGIVQETVYPLIALGVLSISYMYYQKLSENREVTV
ncbi:MAG TPA: DoxX family protein [Saprospiraceae bacterium]|nr:DoxX family protein [Saprospiraceae bacterium]MCC6688242.1 DoxX family protein [Saprospiraceae bacterium]HMV23434.1 DoxX family protein [Saprospiraceae bacterium]HMX83159.1 DoxX family protein [Saprospiraceae bacterium]HMX85395.1 DoxX family protein [Saprospiraceae bacterium]